MSTIARLTLKILQVHTNRNRLCMSISFFFSKTVWERREFVWSMPKTQLKLVNHKLSRQRIDTPSTWRFREASNAPEKSLVQHNSIEKGKLLGAENAFVKRLQDKEIKHERSGMRPAVPEAEKSTSDRRRRTWTHSEGRSSFFFYF